MNKILIIEDNEILRENLEEMLSLSGYEVKSKPNGVEGVTAAQRESPDLIICDVMMPKLDGFGVLKILQQQPQTALIPFIFLTAKNDKNDIRQGMSLGADDYLTKPFNQTELLDAIEKRLKKAQQITNNTQLDQIGKILPPELLDELIKDKPISNIQKKEFLFHEGDPPKHIIYLVSGNIKVFCTNKDGKEFITGIFKSGDFIGSEAILQGVNYNESAAALVDSKIILIPRKPFLILFNKHPFLSVYFIRKMALNISEKEERLLKVAYDSTRKRMADALLYLHEKYNHENFSPIPILRDDLAALVGTAKESVSRILSDFRSEKLISIDKKGAITILKAQELSDVSN